MPVAARLTDPIEHSNELTGLLIGAAVGLAVGIAVVGTGGAALVVVATVGASVCAGAGVGQLVGSLDVTNSIVGGTVTGAIASGSGNVKVNSLLAARATSDSVACDGTPPLYLPSHHGKRVAQGSGTVLINGQPAARIGDKIECGSGIQSGSSNVVFGGETVTTLEIESEIPAWVSNTLMVVGIASAVVLGGPIVAALGLVGGMAGGAGGTWLGGQIFGEGSDGQKIMGFLGGMAGGAAGGKLGSTGKLGSWNQLGKCKLGLEPIDLGSGRVVDSEVDITLPGLIACSWGRTYNSAQAHEKSALGRGGWTHTFEQWVVREPGRTSLRDEEGRDVFFPAIDPGQHAFHRSDRLTLTALEDGGFEAHSLVTRLTRSFAPLRAGEKAVLRAIRDAHGNAITLHYTAGLLSRIVDTAGRELRVVCGRGGHIVRLEVRVGDSLEQWVSYEYSDRGDLAGATDALGHTERYAYDDQHRMAKKTLKNGVSFYYEYDEHTGWCCRSWGDGGLHSGRIRVDLEKRITYLVENEEPRILHWNEDGLVVREETPDGILIGTWEYDQDLYLIAEANGAGETKRYEHDARGNRVRTLDAAGNVTECEYAGDLLARWIGPDKRVIRFSRKEKGELREVVYPSGLRYQLDHDERGRLLAIQGEEGVLHRFGYDHRHDSILEVDARNATTRYEYDALGRPLQRKDALGKVTQVERDRLGRPVAITQPDGAVTRRQYDSLGNVTRDIDALGQVLMLEYAGTGVLSRMVQPDGDAWTLRYDGVERLLEVRNPHDEVYGFTYDKAGRVVSERTFDERTLKYAYSGAGHVSSIEQPDGTRREIQHDPLGNVVGDHTPESDVTLERDKLGRLARAVLQERSGKVVTELRRDEQGLVMEELQNERSIRYRHDAYGRRIERVLPDGSTTRYGYDPEDALAWVEHDGQRFTLERDLLGREVSRRHTGGSVEIQSGYDSMDRLIERHAFGGGAHAALSRRTWKYDPTGRVAEIADDRWGTTSYQHDSIGQLVGARRRSHHEAFQYDAAGSLRNIFRGLKQAGNAQTWDVEAGNRLTRTDKARYEYDARGRRVKKVALVDAEGVRAGDVTTHLWDDRDRLREVQKASGERVLFTYDAFGRRVGKEVLPAGGEGERRVVEFLWDGEALAADRDTVRGARVFVHEPGTFVPMLQAEQGQVFAVVNDHLGMPKELIDEDGRTAWSAAHSAWGKVAAEHRDPSKRQERPIESPFRLLGQYADAETGLCCTRFRYFDADVGRWCSPDPLGLLGGRNLCQFNGSPAVEVDPLGLAACIGKKISDQKQFRHVKDKAEWTRNGEGGYVKSVAEAQAVLDAYHGGKTNVLGQTKSGNTVVEYPGVTGYNNNPRSGFMDQPTNVFMIKGTSSPSVVPISPTWKP